MSCNFWVNGRLVPGVIVANSGIPFISGTADPTHDGCRFPVVYIINPSGGFASGMSVSGQAIPEGEQQGSGESQGGGGY